MRVGITGPTGFFGYHLRWFLLPYKNEIEVVTIDRDFFEARRDELPGIVKTCDAILHLAGAHPGNTKDQEAIYAINMGLVQALTAACDEAKAKPYIIFASSTHVHRNTPYGKSKKEVGAFLTAWGKERGAKITNLIIPNEFGEWGNPLTSSVVSTFCHQLATGAESTIAEGVSIPLIYAQDVARRIYELLHSPSEGDRELAGADMSVSAIYTTLKGFLDSYAEGVIPAYHSALERQLFSTLRSHLFTNGFYPRAFQPKSDARGTLVEVIKSGGGGQAFLSTTVPGATRGNHYHVRKLERFAVVKGKAIIRLRKLLFDEIFSYEVSGDRPTYIDMPAFMTHNITNTGSGELVTAFWTDELYNPMDADTFLEKV